MTDFETNKQKARTWFETLRSDLCAAFEKLEDEAGALYADMAPGRFEA